MPSLSLGLYPILDVERAGSRDLMAVAAAWAGMGLSLQQLRAKRLPAGPFLQWATRLAAVVPQLIVNDRLDIARLAGAAGVHLGQDDLPLAAIPSCLPAGALAGFSTHNRQQIAAVVAAAVQPSYLAIGPVFATSSKPNPDPVVGLDGVRRARALWPGTLVAIGGITPANCQSVWRAGADAVAVISGLWDSPDPVAAARQFLLAFRGLSCHSPQE